MDLFATFGSKGHRAAGHYGRPGAGVDTITPADAFSHLIRPLVMGSLFVLSHHVPDRDEILCPALLHGARSTQTGRQLEATQPPKPETWAFYWFGSAERRIAVGLR